MKTKGTIFSLIVISCLYFNVPGYANAIPTNTNINNAEDNAYFEPKRLKEGSLEEMYQDVFMTMLLPYINKAVDNYYEKHSVYSPGVDPWQPDIISIERPNGYRTFQFIIKLKVLPYIAAHVSIGEDIITLRVSFEDVTVENFQHLKDYPIPPWLQKKFSQYTTFIPGDTTSSLSKIQIFL